MSSHYWVERGYGMFITNEEAKNMVVEYMTQTDSTDDIEDVLEDILHEQFNASVVNDDCYDGRETISLADGYGRDFVNGVLLYGSKIIGTIFADEAKTECYKNIDDMAGDFKNKYGKYLPTDFDYKAHLVEFRGTIFA